MKIWAVNLSTQIPPYEFDNLLSMLDPEKQKRIQRFRKWQDRQRGLVGDILIRIIATKELGLKNSEISYITNEYGKPFIKDIEGFEFNISHSGDWIVCAVDSKEVGIDIERISPINLDIADRFFSKIEHEDLLEKTEENRLSYFYDLWTLKESFIKICGKGLSIPLDSFAIRKDDKSIKVETKFNNYEYFFHQYNIDIEYKLSVCSVENHFPKKVIIKDFDDIFEEAQEI